MTAADLSAFGTVEWLQVAAFCLAALAQTAFVALYSTRRWWVHFVGRALWTKSTALMLMIDVVLFGAFFDYPGEVWVTTAIYWLVGLACAYQLGALIIQLHRDGPTGMPDRLLTIEKRVADLEAGAIERAATRYESAQMLRLAADELEQRREEES